MLAGPVAPMRGDGLPCLRHAPLVTARVARRARHEEHAAHHDSSVAHRAANTAMSAMTTTTPAIMLAPPNTPSPSNLSM